ncbi:glycoside hydrolase [Brucella tritici]|uniref:glycoside hydrolase n=1 Tax=Brucella tritici TaxID=94626 RepID=UPI0020005E97|nr:glycoside hydrolase [Brucella tritici]
MRTPRLAISVSLLALAMSGAVAEEWLPVKENNLEISSGSPLDFSGFLTNIPIEEKNRLVANADGRFAQADTPDQAMRLQCAAIAWGPPSSGVVDHAFIDRYVRQLRLHGYNIARFHFVDADLMLEQAGDFDFRPDALDRMRYLMAALKREGIYWIIDGLTSESSALGGKDIDRWGPEGNVKRRTYVDDAAFDHWLRFQKEVYATVNPYTGLAPLQDPALALVIPFNENGIEFTSFVHEHDDGTTFWPGYRPAFNAFLKKHYADSSTLSRAWGGLAPDENLEQQTVQLPVSRSGGGRRLRDFQAFVVESERSLAQRMEQALRDLGYRGLIASYNNLFTVQTALSRQNQKAVVANTYQDWIGTLNPGTEIRHTSSIGDTASYVSEIAVGRWLGRPFLVTEYEHLFWSRYRYEAGLVFPAYAALQGWDGICRHGQGPLTLAFDEAAPFRQRIVPYTFAVDPVARAGETLASLLFRRGDVETADFNLPFMMQGKASLGESLEFREPARLKPLALVGGVGLATKELAWPQGLQKKVAVDYRNVSLDNVLQRLKAAGLLADDNITNPSQGLFESTTGQIRLDRNKLRMQVVTPKTEAVAFAELKDHLTLNELSLGNAEERGLFAVSAIDEKLLKDSEKLLIIFASDARNSDMRFRDKAEKIIEDWGRLPVTLLRNRVDVNLAQDTVSWTISPVGLDGKIHEKIAAGSGPIAFRLDNGAGKAGPTTFFLLERKLAAQ